MKFRLLFLTLILATPIRSQTLQLHYELRHSMEPARYERDFPQLYFEYFKGTDAGSFQLKMQSDFTGEKSNIGQFYLQVSKNLRFWKPAIFLQVQYSGGLGISEPGSYGYYIRNAFSAGPSYPFRWNDAWCNAFVSYTFNALERPSHDILCSFYWGKGFWDYFVEFTGDIQFWTLNKDQGPVSGAGEGGKRFYFYGEPQIWFNIDATFALGSKLNLYYHVLTNDGVFQAFPTLAVRYKP
ncbi:MAG TPA: DUF5020 family protein [Bacteroidota bacterium]|nr:DUF5020 family protein [Bacteroidota bacterium]